MEFEIFPLFNFFEDNDIRIEYLRSGIFAFLEFAEKTRVILGNKNVEYDSIMFAACNHGYVETVKVLLTDSRIDPGEDRNLAIQQACANGHIDVVKLLMADSRVNPYDYNNFALRRAQECGYHEIVKLLRRKK